MRHQQHYEFAKEILNGKILNFNEGIELMKKNFMDLGIIADNIRKEKVKNFVYFVSNKHVNYTNICAIKCKLCAFYKNDNHPEAYTLGIENILKSIKNSKKEKITEVHIVGGLNPHLNFEYYEEILKKIRKNFPEVVIKAFSAEEIAFFAKKEKCSIKEILSRLKDNGLNFMPGGGAEILNDEIREKICPNKIKSDEWLKIHEIAHSLNIKSNATMLYGHIEQDKHIIEHLKKLRELQEKTKGFLSFIPLKFRLKNTKLREEGIVKKEANVIKTLKIFAISRIFLHNFNHITAYWPMISKGIAQIALNYGANDLNGTIGEENIAYSAGTSERSSTREEMIHLIKSSGRIPVERTTDFKILHCY